jgi:hypothetical protein
MRFSLQHSFKRPYQALMILPDRPSPWHPHSQQIECVQPVSGGVEGEGRFVERHPRTRWHSKLPIHCVGGWSAGP